MAELLGKASGAVRAAVTGPNQDAAGAGLTYESAVREAREALPGIRPAVVKAREALLKVTPGRRVDLPAMPNAGLFRGLPEGAFTRAERGRVRRAEAPLNRLRGQVDTVTAAVTGWLDVLDTARREALLEARSLI